MSRGEKLVEECRFSPPPPPHCCYCYVRIAPPHADTGSPTPHKTLETFNFEVWDYGLPCSETEGDPE